MMPKIRAASAPPPSTVPGTSTRPACGSALSGRTMAATASAARPNATLNQKIPRQFHAPTSAPPRTGPSASENPDTAAQTPSARLRLRSSGYSCRIIDKVPGSLAAAPSPMTDRAAMSIPMLGATAASAAPAQYTPAPASMIFLRPNLSPSIPKASIKLANVRAYAPTTHCSAETPPCRSDGMLASATLTTVLSRKVRNSTVHRQARARGRRRGVSMPALACASVSATPLAPADSGQLGAPLGVLQVGKPAEARDGYLPDAVQVDGGADLVLQQRRAEQQDLVVHRGLRW